MSRLEAYLPPTESWKSALIRKYISKASFQKISKAYDAIVSTKLSRKHHMVGDIRQPQWHAGARLIGLGEEKMHLSTSQMG